MNYPVFFLNRDSQSALPSFCVPVAAFILAQERYSLKSRCTISKSEEAAQKPTTIKVHCIRQFQ